MSIPKTQFTKDGFEKINNRFQFLTGKRPEAIKRLQTARELGDLSENGAYKAARFEVSSIDRELRHLIPGLFKTLRLLNILLKILLISGQP